MSGAQKTGAYGTGLEDNIRMDRHQLAPSNAALVKRAANIAEHYGRVVASPIEAKNIEPVMLLAFLLTKE